MAGSPFYIMENVNLFCGDDDPSTSKYLTIETLKLPDLQRTTANHNAGGVRGPNVNWVVGMEALKPTFKLKGFDEQLLGQFGLGANDLLKYTAYGALRNRMDGSYVEVKAIMQGTLTKIAPDQFQRNEIMGHDHEIDQMIHYELWFNGLEKIYWDWLTNTFRTGGVDQNAQVNKILRIS